MDRLTDKHFWEKNYVAAHIETSDTVTNSPAPGNFFQKKIKTYFGPNLTDYSNYLLWDVLLPQYLPKSSTLKVLEIGSAPGYHLLRLNKTFGYVPYGVEYTDAGAQMNRQLFEAHGFDAQNVIKADAFSLDFQAQYHEAFDVVTSFGFVEHFEDVRPVIKHHLNLLKVGGSLVVQIPRIAGLNYWIAKTLNRESLPMHNLQIMQKEVFQDLFAGLPVEMQFCDYVGTAKLILCLPHNCSGWLAQVTNGIKNLQLGVNLSLRWLYKNKGWESAFFSPHLVFVGKKIASPETTTSCLAT